MAHHEPRLLVAADTFTADFEGVPHTFIEDQTRVREGHPILKGIEHLFKPIKAHYEIEAASAAPGERRGEQ